MSEDTQAVGSPPPLSCPECGGGLSEVQDGPTLRFRCQVGHAFSPDSMQEARKNAELLRRVLFKPEIRKTSEQIKR